jgi:hypothetical protein
LPAQRLLTSECVKLKTKQKDVSHRRNTSDDAFVQVVHFRRALTPGRLASRPSPLVQCHHAAFGQGEQ